MSKPFLRFYTFFITTLLIAVPVILSGCVDQETEDPRNMGKPGNIGCDEHCLRSDWDNILECELEWNHCIDACNNDESCQDLCYEDWYSCYSFDIYSCGSKCQACLSEYNSCRYDCSCGDIDCLNACLDTFIVCGEWDASCWSNCSNQYNQCLSGCPNYTCMDDCDVEYYENCMPGCLDTN